MKLGFPLRKGRKRNEPLVYQFLPYATGVLRVLGWAVLVIGVIASIVFGLRVVESGMSFGGIELGDTTVGGMELIGVGPGISVIIIGMVGSFLAWLFLLVSRELVYLFIHVKNNTQSAAKRLTHESY
jgi:hypothetical protein